MANWILLILVAIILISWLLIKNKKLRWLIGLISIALLILEDIGISANLKNHWGMKEQTVTTISHQIYSAGPTNSHTKLLLKQQIGSHSNDYVLVFRDHPDSSKATAHYVPNKKDMSQAIKEHATYHLTNNNRAMITTRSIYWIWKNKFLQFFLSSNNSTELKERQIIVEVPKKDWIVLTPKQAKALAKHNQQLTDIQRQQIRASELMN